MIGLGRYQGADLRAFLLADVAGERAPGLTSGPP
jgi:hypothetical protein